MAVVGDALEVGLVVVEFVLVPVAPHFRRLLRRSHRHQFDCEWLEDGNHHLLSPNDNCLHLPDLKGQLQWQIYSSHSIHTFRFVNDTTQVESCKKEEKNR